MTDKKIWLTLPVAILIGAVLIAGSVLYIGFDRAPADEAATGLDAAGDTLPSVLADPDALVPSDARILGDVDAPVTIVEFSDFQCPFCRSFWNETISQLKSEYIDTGKVRLVYRDFPLSFHPSAEPAAQGGWCAQEQGKFWEYHDAVFAGQMQREQDPTQVSTTVTFSVDDLKTWARSAGLDGTAFDSCLDSGKYADKVQGDVDAADAATAEVGVQNEWGTPGFFVNGVPLIGAQPFSVFQQIIEASL